MTGDVPSISKLLRAVCPDDQSRWLNVDSFFLWKQPHPADVAPFDVERREIWLRCAGFFVRAERCRRIHGLGLAERTPQHSIGIRFQN